MQTRRAQQPITTRADRAAARLTLLIRAGRSQAQANRLDPVVVALPDELAPPVISFGVNAATDAIPHPPNRCD